MGSYPQNQVQQYQTKSVFVSSGAADSNQTVSGSIRQLSRIQGVDWQIPYPVEMVTYLDAGDEAYLGSATPVDVDISYLHTNGRNEQALGLIDWVASGQLGFNLEQEKNLYITIENTPGIDALGAPVAASRSVIGMGQALMTSYNMSVREGGMVLSRATMNCLTAFSYTGATGDRVPAVNYQDGSQLAGLFILPPPAVQYNRSATGIGDPVAALAIASRDMFLLFPEGTSFGVTYSGTQGCYLQGFDLTLTMARRELKPLGNQYPPNRAVFYPITVDLTTTATVNTYQRDQLDRIQCLGTGQSVYLIVKQPCSNSILFGLYFDRLQIENQSFSSDIGTNDTASTKWRGLLTSPYTTLFSPFVQQLVNSETQQPWGTSW